MSIEDFKILEKELLIKARGLADFEIREINNG